MSDARFRIDESRVTRLARALSAVAPSQDWFVPRLTGVAASHEADFWCLVIAICQQTRTARGVVDGQAVRGSDYLVARAVARVRDEPEVLTPSAVVDWDEGRIRSFFSDDGHASSSTLDRAAERVRLLTGLARRLVDEYDGTFRTLVARAGGKVAGPGGVEARLAETEAYADPARKKTWLLLLFLRRIGVVELVDAESIGLPVDYHIMRVLLRAGAVEVVSDDFARRLADGAEVSLEDDAALRVAVSRAGTALAAVGGRDMFEIDNLLWMIGRNCCFYEHDPVCQESKPCAHREGCSLVTSTDWDCPDKCPLEGSCRGSKDPAYARLKETCVDTHYY